MTDATKLRIFGWVVLALKAVLIYLGMFVVGIILAEGSNWLTSVGWPSPGHNPTLRYASGFATGYLIAWLWFRQDDQQTSTRSPAGRSTPGPR